MEAANKHWRRRGFVVAPAYAAQALAALLFDKDGESKVDQSLTLDGFMF